MCQLPVRSHGVGSIKEELMSGREGMMVVGGKRKKKEGRRRRSRACSHETEEDRFSGSVALGVVNDF